MGKEYDIISTINTPKDAVSIEGNVVAKELITKYDDSYCEKVIDFARDGFFLEGFAGKFNISSEVLFGEWLNKDKEEYRKFQSCYKTAQSCLINYYNNLFISAIQSGNYEILNTVKAILVELMKSVPKEFKSFLYGDLVIEDESERKNKKKIERERDTFSAFTGNAE